MKKIILFLSLMLFVSVNLLAQDAKNSIENPDTVRTQVEHMPRYPGGAKALFKYLSKNIKYPKAAAKNNIEGKVIVTFTVNTEGKVEDVQVEQSLSPECDKEAVRVVKKMRKWKPGIQKGEKVPVKYTLPITFVIPLYGF